jgi:hypothetical protein
MDHSLISTICSQVYQKFPEVRGVQPSILEQGAGHLLVFKGKVTAADGKTISRVVRVVVSPDGKIGKISTSR